MHSGHMLLEGTWPDHVRINMDLANVHVTQIVHGKSWWEELSKQRIVSTLTPATFAALRM